MTFQPIPSEFAYIRGKFYFIFLLVWDNVSLSRLNRLRRDYIEIFNTGKWGGIRTPDWLGAPPAWSPRPCSAPLGGSQAAPPPASPARPNQDYAGSFRPLLNPDCRNHSLKLLKRTTKGVCGHSAKNMMITACCHDKKPCKSTAALSNPRKRVPKWNSIAAFLLNTRAYPKSVLNGTHFLLLLKQATSKPVS